MRAMPTNGPITTAAIHAFDEEPAGAGTPVAVAAADVAAVDGALVMDTPAEGDEEPGVGVLEDDDFDDVVEASTSL